MEKNAIDYINQPSIAETS